jgi:hypothetical protein
MRFVPLIVHSLWALVLLYIIHLDYHPRHLLRSLQNYRLCVLNTYGYGSDSITVGSMTTLYLTVTN